MDFLVLKGVIFQWKAPNQFSIQSKKIYTKLRIKTPTGTDWNIFPLTCRACGQEWNNYSHLCLCLVNIWRLKLHVTWFFVVNLFIWSLRLSIWSISPNYGLFEFFNISKNSKFYDFSADKFDLNSRQKMKWWTRKKFLLMYIRLYFANWKMFRNLN